MVGMSAWVFQEADIKMGLESRNITGKLLWRVKWVGVGLRRGCSDLGVGLTPMRGARQEGLGRKASLQHSSETVSAVLGEKLVVRGHLNCTRMDCARLGHQLGAALGRYGPSASPAVDPEGQHLGRCVIFALCSES